MIYQFLEKHLKGAKFSLLAKMHCTFIRTRKKKEKNECYLCLTKEEEGIFLRRGIEKGPTYYFDKEWPISSVKFVDCNSNSIIVWT